MDPLTHTLASFTLQRAAFPRISRAATLAMVLAGTVADADLLSAYGGPSAYLNFNRAYFHSLLVALVLRVVLHGDAIAALESRTYRGELPRKVAAFPESSSPFHWHGIVETERALHDVEVPVGPSANFDPSSAITAYKPEPSRALDAARNSAVARRFLQVARFPKATVEQTPSGFHIILRAFPDTRESRSGLRVEALIDTDSSGKFLSEALAWVCSSRAFSWR